MRTCRQITEMLTAHMDGALSLGDRLGIDWHLLVCKDCRQYARQLRTTTKATRALQPEPETPPAELMQAFRAQYGQPRTDARKAGPLLVALGWLDAGLGGTRGWVALGGLLVGLVVAAVYASPLGGGLGQGMMCLGMRGAPGVLSMGLLATAAHVEGVRLQSSTYALVGVVPASVAHLAMNEPCGSIPAVSHVLVYHVGAVGVVALLGAALASWMAGPRKAA